MTPQQHATRAVATAVLAVATLVAVSGCSVSAEPSPSPTPTAAFSSEEEAFAAAEEVYRAYNEALNASRSGEEEANPNQYLAGDLLESELDAARELEERGIRIEGPTIIKSFTGVSSNFETQVPTIRSIACLDISEARAIATDGSDVTAQGRSDVYAVDITMSGIPGSLLITNFGINTGAQC